MTVNLKTDEALRLSRVIDALQKTLTYYSPIVDSALEMHEYIEESNQYKEAEARLHKFCDILTEARRKP